MSWATPADATAPRIMVGPLSNAQTGCPTPLLGGDERDTPGNAVPLVRVIVSGGYGCWGHRVTRASYTGNPFILGRYEASRDRAHEYEVGRNDSGMRMFRACR